MSGRRITYVFLAFSCIFLACHVGYKFARSLWNQLVVAGIEVASPAPELEGETGPEGGVLAAGIEVPAGAAGGPDGSLHTLLHFAIEDFLNFRSHFDGLQLAPA